ncbi:MAG: coproporphyrinogen III oxidase family protein, partial [Kiritimatiellae bacterium]|nr:coproporphyrinogen III oxidase family protein [Kiritimatiellia bacterium]
TVEVGPGTLTREKARLLRDHGVTRISIGAQSFDNGVLKWLGRRHLVEDICRTVTTAQEVGFANMGLDLISGLPGVDLKLWRRTLNRAVALQPSHIAIYSLSIEPESHLARLVEQNRVSLPPEQDQLAAIQVGIEVLEDAGFERYEISNYARQGNQGGTAACGTWQCLHNLSFWRGGDYIGFGPAAASRIGRRRLANNPSLDEYITQLDAGLVPDGTSELLSVETDLTERVAFAFRLAEGVAIESFCCGHVNLLATWEQALEELRNQGLVRKGGNRWYLSPLGRNFADAVAERLFEGL